MPAQTPAYKNDGCKNLLQWLFYWVFGTIRLNKEGNVMSRKFTEEELRAIQGLKRLGRLCFSTRNSYLPGQAVTRVKAGSVICWHRIWRRSIIWLQQSWRRRRWQWRLHMRWRKRKRRKDSETIWNNNASATVRSWEARLEQDMGYLQLGVMGSPYFYAIRNKTCPRIGSMRFLWLRLFCPSIFHILHIKTEKQ